MTTRFKIIGGFALMAAIGLILGIAGLISTRMQTSMSNELYTLQKANTGVASVLNAHYIWRQTLTEAVLSGADFTGSLDPDTCALGKWRTGDEAKNITDTQINTYLSQITEPHSFIHYEAKDIVDMLKNGQSEEAKSELLHVILPKTQEVITILTNMESRYAALLDEQSQKIIDFGNQMTVIVIILIVVALITAVLLCCLITSSIMKPLRTITEAAEKIAGGDMDVQVSYHVNDQLGQLVNSFQSLVDSTKLQVQAAESLANGDLTVTIKPRSDKDAMSFAMIKMVDSLNQMFSEIRSSSSQVSIGSKQIADGAQSLAQGSTEQASAIEELSTTISHISDKTRENADISKEAADLSDSIRANAEKGSQQMEHMMQAVAEITAASGQIEKVIKVIDDIAFQTNILALNAAVEAARAGTAGRGFAVVAEEVRNLAAKSADAAKDTGGLIENSIVKAKLGMSIAEETSLSLKKIVDGINRSAVIVAQIAQSSDDQVSAISQVNIGIDQVAHVIQQNSATAQQSAASSEEMSGQSEMLEQLLAQFKLKNEHFSLGGSNMRAIASSSYDYDNSGKY